MITNSDRDQAEAHATPLQMELYATKMAGSQLRAIANQFGITDDDDYREYAITAGDVVLKLLPPAELQTALQQVIPTLTPEVAAGVAQAIIQFATPALQETPNNPGILNPELQAELASYKDAATPEPPPPGVMPAPQPVQPTIATLESEIAELEQLEQAQPIAPIEPVRTMANDVAVAQAQQAQPTAPQTVDGETTYTSDQDTLLHPQQQTPLQPPAQ